MEKYGTNTYLLFLAGSPIFDTGVKNAMEPGRIRFLETHSNESFGMDNHHGTWRHTEMACDVSFRVSIQQIPGLRSATFLRSGYPHPAAWVRQNPMESRPGNCRMVVPIQAPEMAVILILIPVKPVKQIVHGI